MTISLIDPKSGQIYEAPDEAGALAQQQAYGLELATPDQVAAYDLQQEHGTPLEQLKTVPETAAATLSDALGGATQLLTGGKVIERGGEAYSDEAKARRQANPGAAMLGAAVPDLALTGLVPGTGLAGMAGRAAMGGVVAAGGQSAITDEPFSAKDAALYGLTGGVLEGVTHLALGQGMRAVGKVRSAVDGVVERARKMAMEEASREAEPALRAKGLIDNAEEFYQKHQATLDQALQVIDERVGAAPEKMFTPGALKKSVSDNFAAQSDHFLDLAVKLRQAADVTDHPVLNEATQILQDALETNGPKMFEALRQARTVLANGMPASPLAEEALAAIEDSLGNQSLWGKAAAHHTEFAQAADLGTTGGVSVRDLDAREALDARIARARQVASVTGDKKLMRAVRQAEAAVAGADEVTGARLLGQVGTEAAGDTAAGGTRQAHRQRVIDRLREQAGVKPPTEAAPTTLLGKAQKFGDELAEYELDNFVQNALKGTGTLVGHTVGGIPGSVAGYLVGRWLHIRYGDQITRMVWSSAKKALLAEAKRAPFQTAAIGGAAALGGAAAGPAGAAAAAAAMKRGIGAAAERAEQVAQESKKLGERWSRRIWKQQRARAAEAAAPGVAVRHGDDGMTEAEREAFRKLNFEHSAAERAAGKRTPLAGDEGDVKASGVDPTKIAGVALLAGAGAAGAAGQKPNGENENAPLAANAGLIGLMALLGGMGNRRQLAELLGEALHGLSARERMTLRMVTEGAAAENEATLRQFARGELGPEHGPDEVYQSFFDRILQRYARIEGIAPNEALNHAPEALVQAAVADTNLRLASIIETDQELARMASGRPQLLQGGGEGTRGVPELRRMGVREPGQTEIREAAPQPLQIEGEAPTAAVLRRARNEARWQNAELAYREGDIPEQQARDWSRRMGIINLATFEHIGAATGDELDAIARQMAQGWESDFRQMVGQRPNERALEFVEASFRGALDRRQQEVQQVQRGFARQDRPPTPPRERPPAPEEPRPQRLGPEDQARAARGEPTLAAARQEREAAANALEFDDMPQPARMALSVARGSIETAGPEAAFHTFQQRAVSEMGRELNERETRYAQAELQREWMLYRHGEEFGRLSPELRQTPAGSRPLTTAESNEQILRNAQRETRAERGPDMPDNMRIHARDLRETLVDSVSADTTEVAISRRAFDQADSWAEMYQRSYGQAPSREQRQWVQDELQRAGNARLEEIRGGSRYGAMQRYRASLDERMAARRTELGQSPPASDLSPTIQSELDDHLRDAGFAEFEAQGRERFPDISERAPNLQRITEYVHQGRMNPDALIDRVRQRIDVSPEAEAYMRQRLGASLDDAERVTSPAAQDRFDRAIEGDAAAQRIRDRQRGGAERPEDFRLTSPEGSEREPAVVHGLERGMANRLDRYLEDDLETLSRGLEHVESAGEQVLAKERWGEIRDRARAWGAQHPEIGEDAAEQFAKQRFDEQIEAFRTDPDEMMDEAARNLARGGYDLDAEGVIAQISDDGHELTPAMERAVRARYSIRDDELRTLYENAQVDEERLFSLGAHAARDLGYMDVELNSTDLIHQIEQNGASLSRAEEDWIRNRYRNSNDFEEHHAEGERVRREENGDDEAPDSEPDPDPYDDEPRHDRYNPSGARDPNADDGLPKQWALEGAGLDTVAMHDHGGVKNVFGEDGLSLREAKELFALEEFKALGTPERPVRTSLRVTRDEVAFSADGAGVDVTMNFERTPDGLKLYAARLFLPQSQQGQGVAKKLIRSVFPVLEAKGAVNMRANAAEIGKFAWPALGMRPSPAAEETAKLQFGRVLRESVLDRAAADGVLANIDNIRDLADATVPFSAVKPEVLDQIRAQFGPAAQGLFARGDQMKVGKLFLLTQHGSWNHGLSINIDRTDPWYQEFLRRVGLLSAAGLTMGELLKAFEGGSVTFGSKEQGNQPMLDDQAKLDEAAADQQRTEQTAQTQQKLAYVASQGRVLTQNTARALVSPTPMRQAPVTPGITHSAGVASFVGSHGSLRSAFDEKRDTLQRLQLDPMSLVDEMSSQLADLSEAAPQAHRQIVAKTYEIIQFLQDKLPGTVGATLMRPEGTPPSDFALRQFALYYSAATDPSTVLRDLGNNRARREQVQTLQQIWPEVYQNLKVALVDQVSQGRRPSFNQRVRLDLLFDFNEALDRSLSPRLVKALAEYRAQQPTKPDGSTMPSRRSNPSIVGTSPAPQLSMAAGASLA